MNTESPTQTATDDVVGEAESFEAAFGGEGEEGEEAVAGQDYPGTHNAKPESISEAHLKSIVESLVFVADKPVTAKKLAKLTRAVEEDVVRILAELSEDYRGRGIQLVEVGTGYVFRTAAANAPFVRDFVSAKPVKLTRAQLETLAIAAYRQPLTRPELEEIRGVDSGSAVKVLLDKGLVRMLGRKDEPGRPLLYGTTPLFLEFFGLLSLKDLPTLREFTELNDDSRALFERKMGEPVDFSQVEQDVKAAEEASAGDQPDWEAEAAAEEAAIEAAEAGESLEASDSDDESEDEPKKAASDEDSEESPDEDESDDDDDEDEDDDDSDDEDEDDDDDDDDSDDDDDDADDENE